LLADPDGFAVLDRVLERAEAHGVYVVLDLHAAPGGQSKMFPADPEPHRLWDSVEAQQRTVALWRTIASRYRDRTIVAGYDLLNEPDPPDGAALVDLYTRIIQAIREVDPVHLVMLEGARLGSDFSAFTTVLDANEALSFHIYTWFGNDAAKHVASDTAVAARLDVPLWCGEFGENDVASIRDQVGLFAKQGVAGWAFWTWKKVKNRYPALHEIVVTPAWRATIAWITDP
jgi:endoglucanase